MVHVVRGTLIETDIPTKVLILHINEQRPAAEKFVICELDDTRLFVQQRGLRLIEQKLQEYHDKNTYVPPAKDGQTV
jgi:hypothetical protein